MTKNGIKPHWKDSLTSKLLMRFGISLLLVSAIMGAIQYQSLNQFLMKGETQDLQAQLDLFNANQLKFWLNHEKPFPKTWPELSPNVVVGFFSTNKSFEGILSRRQVRSRNPYALEKSFFLKQIKKNRLRTEAILTSPKGMSYLVISEPIYLNQATTIRASGQNLNLSPNTSIIGYAVLSAPLNQIKTILRHQLQVVLVSTIVILIIGGVLTFYLLKKPLQPLSRMSEISSEIAAGNYTLRIPEEPAASEIMHLRFVLNQMLETLCRSLTTETEAKELMARFIGDASHELKTPLTSIRGFLEILLRDPETDAETLTSAHQTMLAETERLIRLTEDLLTLNRLTRQDRHNFTDNSETSVQTVLPELLPLLNSIASYRTLDIKATEITLPIEAGELKQIIYNLIHNAIQHTPVNGKIMVRTGSDDETRYLWVTDNGEGISPQDLPYVFERFYRGSRSRERKSGSGAGLGLAIVWEIVNSRGGKINVESKLNEGTTFKIHFPKI